MVSGAGEVGASYARPFLRPMAAVSSLRFDLFPGTLTF